MQAKWENRFECTTHEKGHDQDQNVANKFLRMSPKQLHEISPRNFLLPADECSQKRPWKRSERSNESLVPFFDCILACPTKKSEPIFNKQNLASPLQHLETKTQTNIFLSKASLSLFGLLAFLCHRLFATLMALQHTHNKRKTSFTLREVDLLYSGHAWCTWHQCGQMEKAKRPQKGHGDGFFATATAA